MSTNNDENENVYLAGRQSHSTPRKVLVVFKVDSRMLGETDQQRKVTIQRTSPGGSTTTEEAVRVEDLNSLFLVFAKEMEDFKDKLETTIKELRRTKKELEDSMTALEQQTALDANTFQWTIIAKDTRNAVHSVYIAIYQIIPMVSSFFRKTN